MEYQKILNLLDSTPNQPSQFRAKNQIKINDDMMTGVERVTLILKLNLKLPC